MKNTRPEAEIVEDKQRYFYSTLGHGYRPEKAKPYVEALWYDSIPVEPHYLASSDDGLDDLLESKKMLIAEKANMIVSGIHQRKLIKEHVFYRIYQDRAECQRMIWSMGEYLEHPRVFALEMKKFELEKEMREEERNSFRDILMLERDLTETMTEYLSERQKLGFMAGV